MEMGSAWISLLDDCYDGIVGAGVTPGRTVS